MRKDELGILIDYIDSRVKSSQKFSVKKGIIQSIDTNRNIASVIIHKDSSIQAQYDINANYQEGDIVGVLCVQGDSSKPSHNLVIGQFSGRPNPIATVNVLSNGDMEAGLDYWSFDSGVGLAEIDTDNAYMGDKCIAITPSIVQDTVSMYQFTGPADCKPNEIYNTEAYFMTEGDASVKVRTQWFNASGGDAAESVKETEALYISSGSGWFPVRMSEISPPTASQCRVDALIEVPELGNKVYVDNVGLYGYYTPIGGSALDIKAGDGIVFTSGSTVINVDLADDSGLYFASGDLSVLVDDVTIKINEHGEIYSVTSGGGAVRHIDLLDMPSSSNADHDGRYYTESEVDNFFNITTGHDHDGVDSKQVDYNDLVNIPSGSVPHQLSDLNDVGTIVYTSGNVLVADGNYFNSEKLSHTQLDDIGVHPHIEVDSHIDDVDIHLTSGQKTELTDGGATTLHSHAVALDDLTDVTIATGERGDVLYNSTTGWANLHHGTAGEALITGGNGADPYWAPPAPASHSLTALHTVTGLTNGHFLKATGATTFAFGAHGLTAADVGAADTDHSADHENGGSDEVSIAGLSGTPEVCVDGWIPAGETWDYEGADEPSYTFHVDADVTTKYSAGMRIRLYQSTGGTKFFIITKVGSYSGGKTIITIYGGTDGTTNGALYHLENEAISSPNYSNMKAPTGFPLDPLNWQIEVSDTTTRSQLTPVRNTWYNLDASHHIDIPVGVWRTTFEVAIRGVSKASQTLSSVAVCLSDANNTCYDNALAARALVGGASGTIYVDLTVHREKVLNLPSGDTLYLNVRTTNDNIAAIYTMNEDCTLIIRAVCAYL